MKALEILEAMYAYHGPHDASRTLTLGSLVPPEKFLESDAARWFSSTGVGYGVTVEDLAKAIVEVKALQKETERR